jgi:hypothetical protein
MKILKSGNDSQNRPRRLRNFDLSVEEIRTIKAIKDMTQSLEDIKDKNTQSDRVEFFRNEIIRLEEQLEDIRDNTLIR